MGLRDLVLVVAFFGALPIVPFRPFLGLLMFSCLAYFRPQEMSWALRSMQLSQYTALAMFLGLGVGFLLPKIVPRERVVTWRPPTIGLIAIWVWVFLCCQTAVDPAATSRRLDSITVVIIIAVLTTGLVRTRERFRWMAILIGASLGALGLKYALYGALRGGAVFTKGPGGFMVDNNSFALCLNMALPLLAGLAFTEKSRAMRMLALLLAAGSVLTIIFTFSRGGLLTLIAVAGLLVWSSGKRMVAAVAVAFGIGAFLLVAGGSFKQRYLERAGTIATYDEDASARGRLEEWERAFVVASDYPLMGVGPGNWYVIYEHYTGLKKARVTHNSFLQFMVDTGYPGLVLLVGLLSCSLYRLQRLRRRVEEEWARTYARMLQISIIAFVIGGSLLDMAYLDLIYHLIALGVGLEVAAHAEAKADQRQDEPTAEVLPWYMVEPAR